MIAFTLLTALVVGCASDDSTTNIIQADPAETGGDWREALDDSGLAVDVVFTSCPYPMGAGDPPCDIELSGFPGVVEVWHCSEDVSADVDAGDADVYSACHSEAWFECVDGSCDYVHTETWAGFDLAIVYTED